MILDALVARAVTASAARRRARLRDEAPHLQDVLARRLAAWFADRRLGAGLELHGVRTARDLSRAIPLRTYDQQAPDFDTPDFWALTSGTTSGVKELPVTSQLLQTNAAAFKLFLLCSLHDLRTVAPLLGKILFLGSSTSLERGPDGILRGPATSIAVRQRGGFFKRRIIPGDALDDLEGWPAKMARLAELASETDIRIVAGTPPWLLALCRRLQATHGVTSLRELWPRLRLVVTGGTFPEPYLPALETALGPVAFRNMFSATEAFFAFQDSEEPGLLPLSDAVFFEFVPVEHLADPDPPRLLLADVQVGVEYGLVVSSWAGLLGYPMGDTVRFVSTSPPRLVVSGRTAVRANLAGEKVGLEQIEAAAVGAAESLGIRLEEFSVVLDSPGPEHGPRYVWLIERRSGTASESEVAAAVDRTLSELSWTYGNRRQGDPPALEAPRVRFLPPGWHLDTLTRRGRAGGHHKIPRIWSHPPEELPEGARWRSE